MSDISISFSYAPEDEPFLVELKKHLQLFKRQGLINEWYDNNINAGSDWQQKRAAQLDRASIIVLLISPDFMASDYVYGVGMKRAMERHEAGTARVIPVLLKSVYLENAPFADLTPLPTNTRPIATWRYRSDAFLDVAKALHAVIDDVRSKPSNQHPFSSNTKDESSSVKDDFSQPVGKPGTTIFVYDIHAKWVSAVTWSPDGERIASGGGDGTVHIWDSETGHNFLTYRSHSNLLFSRVWDARWSPDGRFIASCGLGVTVRVWDADTGKDLVLYNHHMLTSFMTDTFTLSWSPDGTSIASATGGLKDIDQTIHVWDAVTGRTQLKYAGHASGAVVIFDVRAIAWSPDGRYIASGGTDKTVKRWKLDPMKLFHTAQIWNASTGQHIVTCNGSSNYISSIAWSPDSKYIATAEEEAVVCVWNVHSGDNVLTYRFHTETVRVVAWSPDGSRIASAGNDHTVQIWHATTGKILYVYREHTCNVAALAWSPDGTRIASAGSNGVVRIWQAV